MTRHYISTLDDRHELRGRKERHRESNGGHPVTRRRQTNGRASRQQVADVWHRYPIIAAPHTTAYGYPHLFVGSLQQVSVFQGNKVFFPKTPENLYP